MANKRSQKNNEGSNEIQSIEVKTINISIHNILIKPEGERKRERERERSQVMYLFAYISERDGSVSE